MINQQLESDNKLTIEQIMEFKDRLKFPDNIQYKINSESVEIKYK